MFGGAAAILLRTRRLPVIQPSAGLDGFMRHAGSEVPYINSYINKVAQHEEEGSFYIGDWPPSCNASVLMTAQQQPS